nr:hypothetical protein SYMBAF_190067 [Serratia symbiotica]
MQAALDHLRNEGETINEEDEDRLSPLRHAHINMLGHYTFTLAELVTKGQLSGSLMTGDCHVRFRGSAGGKFPCATR